MHRFNNLAAFAALTLAFVSLLICSYLEAAHPDIDRLAMETDSGSIHYTARPFHDIPQVIRDFSWRSYSSDPLLSALDFIAAFPDLVGVRDPYEDLVHESTVHIGGQAFVRFQQYCGGLPVVLRGVVIKTDASGAVVYAAGNALPADPDVGLQPLLDRSEAVDAAANSVQGGLSRTPAASLQVLVNPGETRLVWAVSLGTANPAGSWIVLVDAATGEIAGRINRLMTATGKVYEQNPIRGDPIEVELERLEGEGTALTGEKVLALRWMGSEETPIQTAEPDGEGNFLYDPSEEQPDFEDPFVEVNAYYHGDLIANYFLETHGYGQERGRMPFHVNYYESVDEEGNPLPFENAMCDFDTWAIYMGQAPTVDTAYDASILYHEYTHSVIDSVAHMGASIADDYGFILMPGGIHEGIADYYAATLTDDPDMSEYFDISRHLVNENVCPTDMMGEPHFDGLVIGGTFWEIREEYGPEITDSLVFRALNEIPMTASYASLAEAMLEAVDDLITDGTLTDEDRGTIQGILDDRGMTICDRVIALDSGLEFQSNLFGLDLFGFCEYLPVAALAGISVPSQFQWSIEVPEDATTLIVSLDVELEDHWLHARSGDFVEFEMVDIYGFQAPLKVKEADVSLQNSTGVTLTPYTDPPLLPGETYYFAITYLACPAAVYTISAETSDEPVPEPEPEPVDEDLVEAPEEPAEAGDGADEEPEPVAEAGEPDASDAAEEEEETLFSASGGGCGCRMVRGL